MLAARLHPESSQLVVEEVPEPQLRPGSVIVRLEAAFVPHFIAKIAEVSGGYSTPPRPFTPGFDGIGRVERVAEGVRGLTIGERVYCDVYYEPAHPARTGERAFLGNFAIGAGSDDLIAEWPDGVYAEKICLPADCIVPLRTDTGLTPAVLCRMGWLGTAYAGLRKIDLRPGAVVAVSGASGLLGASAVLCALALGASRIYAIGRRIEALEKLAAVDLRIVPVSDIAAIPQVDAVLTSVDGRDSSALEALLPHIRRNGACVIVGATQEPLPLNIRWLMANDITLRGSLWFERHMIGEMLALAASRHLPLHVLAADDYGLSRINEAITASATRPDPLRHVALAFSR